MAVPDHISSICYWTPSRIAGGVWTHAWEREYRDVAGLLGVYLRHPFHLTCADRWFECEVPTSIVLLALAHIYRWADGPVPP